MPVVDNAIYRGGRRVATPASLEETFETREAHGGFAWIGLYRPTDAEIDALASEFGLHPLSVEDAKKGHQRAKLERYGDTLFVVLRPARSVTRYSTGRWPFRSSARATDSRAMSMPTAFLKGWRS